MDKQYRVYTKGKKYRLYCKLFNTLASAKKCCFSIREKGYTDDIYIISSKSNELKYNLYVMKNNEFYKSETIDIYSKSLYEQVVYFAISREEYHKNCLNDISENVEVEGPVSFTGKYDSDFIFWLYDRDYLNLKAFI